MNPQPLVVLDDVKKTYQMGDIAVPALRGVTLAIDRGDFVAIMGASGSGKSTLMNIIGCLDRPTSGSYTIAGREAAKLDRAERAELRNQMIGFVFQNFNLLSRTSALENVELPLFYAAPISPKERKARATRSLARVGLADRLDHTPNRLSGGQQQRVAIARALVTEPPLLLADEPTGNLDSKTSIEIIALFQELQRSGITVVLVTHETDIAMYATRVIVVKDGQVQSDQRQQPLLAQRDDGSAEEPRS